MGGSMGTRHLRPCISNHSDTAWRLIIRLHDESGYLVAQYLLPHRFFIKANGNDNGGGDGESRAHIAVRQQIVRIGCSVPNPPSGPVWEPRAPPPPASHHPGSMDHYSQFDSNNIASVLRKLAPAEGPVSGGPTILLSGTNFPPPSQQVVYARFGTAVIPTVWIPLF
jgi:hypothetical protein